VTSIFKRKHLFYYLAIIPSLVIIGLFISPLILTFYYAFTDIRGNITLGTLNSVIADPVFSASYMRVIIYFILNILIKFLLATGAALCLRHPFKGRRILSALNFAPYAFPMIPLYFDWFLMYHPSWGVIPYMIRSLGLTPPNFLTDPNLAMYFVCIAHAWAATPLWTMIMTCGITSVPEEAYESAKIDGATPTRMFFKITIPYIKKYLLMNALLSCIWVTGEVTSVWLMTRGGPGTSSHILASYAYLQLYTGYYNKAAAMLTLGIPLVVFLMFLLSRVLAMED